MTKDNFTLGPYSLKEQRLEIAFFTIVPLREEIGYWKVEEYTGSVLDGSN